MPRKLPPPEVVRVGIAGLSGCRTPLWAPTRCCSLSLLRLAWSLATPPPEHLKLHGQSFVDHLFGLLVGELLSTCPALVDLQLANIGSVGEAACYLVVNL